jgi:peptide-methionine (R)-S-oxide reductase
MATFDLRPLTSSERERLVATLSEEEKAVLLHEGTEPPFCGGLLNNKHDGTYICTLCGLPLFAAATKFESGTGWPSFFEPYQRAHIREVIDRSYGRERTEIRCARCDGHLGHVFADGPQPTGLRYCLNSVALHFVPEGEALPDKLGRGNSAEGSATPERNA